jgi:hypothetical protein
MTRRGSFLGRASSGWAGILLALTALHGATIQAQTDKKDKKDQAAQTSAFDQRIVTPETLQAGSKPGSTAPWRVIGWPCGKIMNGMESGLIAFEKHKLRERFYDLQHKLGTWGFRPLFGGLGEGSGMGLGTVWQQPDFYDPAVHETAVQLLGRIAFLSGYQEFGANFHTSPFPESRFVFLANYQWRPYEPFYGFGQHSSKADASSFALRQGAFSVRWTQHPIKRLSFGSEYTLGLMKGLPAPRGPRPSIENVFGSDVPGLNEKTRVHSMGLFFTADLLQGDYGLGAHAHFGASWQESFGERDFSYGRIETKLEGRLPIVRGRSVLIGQARTDLTREAGGTEVLPFYLYPRIGGSATLRGFPLDRFYGRNMVVATVEYRWAIHPGIEFQFFFDEGQVFNRTSDLSFWDWHRNYGIGFRLRNATGTQLRFEIATGENAFAVHIIFGDRPPRPLGGPIRYPNFRP